MAKQKEDKQKRGSRKQSAQNKMFPDISSSNMERKKKVNYSLQIIVFVVKF